MIKCVWKIALTEFFELLSAGRDYWILHTTAHTESCIIFISIKQQQFNFCGGKFGIEFINSSQTYLHKILLNTNL